MIVNQNNPIPIISEHGRILATRFSDVDLAEAAKQPIEGGFIKIETEEDPKQLELEASSVAAEATDLQENYGIPALQRLQ